jgi:acetyl esterase/lipase
VSTEQRETLDAILRQSAFPAGSDVAEQRRLLRELLSAQPLPAEITVTAAALGGVPTAEITVDGIEPRHVVLYFHGGVYAMGDAALAAGLASQVGRRTAARVISVGYRLAPEHPYPAAVDDALAAYEALLDNGTAPSDIAFAGESAGGGLAIATLVNARDHGLPLPAAAFVMSPYAGSGSRRCGRRPHAACALFGCGPASASRYPYGGRPPRYRPCSRACTAIAVRTRMLVRVISRFDDNPSTVIACSSCSDAKSSWPPASGIHSCTP